jgi:all-trans-retinol 13,14-reductase
MAKRLYEHFSEDIDFSPYEYIIIGSGIGGLTCAIFLAKAGKRVLVLERHYIPGGFLHTFRRKKGLEWDVGVHYVGDMDNHSPIRHIFNYITNNQQQWADVGDVYDTAYFGNDEYHFVKGLDNLKLELKTKFPSEQPAIDAYFDLVKKVNHYSVLFLAMKASPWLIRNTFGIYITKKFKHFASQTTYDVLSALTNNEKLKSVLCAQCGDYGLTPKQSSFSAHAMVTNHFTNGANYPVGGADKIYKNLIDVLYQNGGKVLVKADVSEIVVKKNTVQGVIVNDKFIECKKVISNAGARNTYQHLLKNHPTSALKTIQNIKPSHSHLCLYIGLDASAEALNLPKNNIWFYNSYDMDASLDKAINPTSPDIEFAYISFPSAKDSDWDIHHKNTATIQAITVSNIELFSEFKDQAWLKRDEKYTAMKEQFTEKMLRKLYEYFPQIEGHVIHTEVSTPLSTQHFMNYESGEIYGLEHSPERFMLNDLSATTSIKGLYLTGQDITLVGVVSAMMSGVITAINILKWRVFYNFKDMSQNHRGN